MSFQSCGDTLTVFNFGDGFMGGNANKIEWAADSILTSYQSSNSLSGVNLSVSTGGDTTIWLRCIDSISGCVSQAVSSEAMVHALPDTFTAYVTDTLVCPGSSTSVNISSSLSGVMYTVNADTGVVNSSLGNGSTLTLSTGTIYATDSFTVTATDSVSGCTRQFSSLHKVGVLPKVITPVFALGDTSLTCLGSTVCFTASSANSIGLIYHIASGGAVIDSITGCVGSVTSAFKVVAVAVDSNSCSIAKDTLSDSVDSILPPAAPPSLTVRSDTAYTFTFNITTGCGGNEIEWATDSLFDSAHIVVSPATISITVDTSSYNMIWARSRDSANGSTSRPTKVFLGNSKILPNHTLQLELFKASANTGLDTYESNDDQIVSYGFFADGPDCLSPETGSPTNYSECVQEPYYTCETAYLRPYNPFPESNDDPNAVFQVDPEFPNISSFDVADYELVISNVASPHNTVCLYYGNSVSSYPFRFQGYNSSPNAGDPPFVDFGYLGGAGLYEVYLKYRLESPFTYGLTTYDTAFPSYFCHVYMQVEILPQPAIGISNTNPNCSNNFCFTTNLYPNSLPSDWPGEAYFSILDITNGSTTLITQGEDVCNTRNRQ